MEERLYTIIIFSENLAGVLNQITNVFTRRQLNIESLNASASGVENIHRYTITCKCDEEAIITLTRQIEKKIDVVKADYYTADEVFAMEQALYKISTPKLLENKSISESVRACNGKMVEVNPTYSIISKEGNTEEIRSLYHSLKENGALLQFVESGIVAVTKSERETLSEFLEQRRTSLETESKE